MATLTGIISWYANFDQNVRSAIQLAIKFYQGNKGQSPRERSFVRGSGKDQLDKALTAASTLRVELVGLLNNPSINPGTAAEILSSLDKILQPFYDYQKNPSGVVPDPGQKLFEWYKKYLKPLGA